MRSNISFHQKVIQPQYMNQSMNVPREDLRLSQLPVNQQHGQDQFQNSIRVQQNQYAQPYRIVSNKLQDSQFVQGNQYVQNSQYVQNNQFVRVQNPSIQKPDYNNLQQLQQIVQQKDAQIIQLNQSLSQIALKFNEVHEQLKGQSKSKGCNKCADFDQLQFQIQQERIIHQERLAQNQNEILKLKLIIENSESELDQLKQKNNINQQQVQELIIKRKISETLQNQQNNSDQKQKNFEEQYQEVLSEQNLENESN